MTLGVSGIQTGADIAFPGLRYLPRPVIQNLDAFPAALACRAPGPVVFALAVRVAEEGTDRTAGDLLNLRSRMRQDSDRALGGLRPPRILLTCHVR